MTRSSLHTHKLKAKFIAFDFLVKRVVTFAMVLYRNIHFENIFSNVIK